MQRSIWVSEEEWNAIKEAAYLARKTLSQYLVHLHKMNITTVLEGQSIVPHRRNGKGGLNSGHPPILKREDVSEDHPSIIKKPVVDSGATRYHNPRPKGQDGIKKKG